jgi:hypothetical protein
MFINYSPTIGLKKTIAFIQKCILALVLIWHSGIGKTEAQVAITAPALTLTACTSFPTLPDTLSNIVIAETNPSDISGSGTLVLSLPSAFQVIDPGSISVTGTEITNVSVTATSNSTIMISFDVLDTLQIDTIILSGIQTRGIFTPTPASDIIRTGGTSIINGDTFGTVHATLSSTDAPSLSSSATPPATCSGLLFSYAPLSTVPNTTFTWTRAAAVGISNTSNNGNDSINEILTDTTTSSVNVTYVYTLTANGCTNPTSYSVTTTINPTPTLTSSLTPPSICSGTVFSYIPFGPIAGYTFSWTRQALPGISNLSANGNDNPTEMLVDTTSSAVNVTYTYTVSANGCTNPNPYDVVVTVNPLPIMTSMDSIIICNGITLSIPLTSNINSTYTWIAADNVNTTGESLSTQTNDTLNNTITNTSTNLQTVSYAVIPTSITNACVGQTQTVILTSVPTLQMINDSIDTICSGTMLTIPLVSNVLGTYTWIANDNPNTTGESISPETADTLKNTIINTSNSIQLITYTVTPTSIIGNCLGIAQTITITVNPSATMTSTNATTICSGEQLITPLTSDIAANYTWIATDNVNTSGESSTLQASDTLNQTITNHTNTIQLVNYTITPISLIGNCAGIAQTYTTTIKPAPVSDAGIDLNLCSGNTDTIGTTNTSGYSYAWLPSYGLSDSTVSNPITTTINNDTSAISTTYFVTTTDNTSTCKSTDSVVVTINPQPTLTVSNPTPICAPNTIDLTDTLLIAGTIGTGTYTYYLDSNATVLISTPSAFAYSDTTYIKLTATGGCYDIKPITTVIHPAPISNAGNDVNICSGGLDSIGTLATSGYTYLWNTSIGLNDSTASNPLITRLNNDTTPLVTNYIVTTKITATGCQSTDSAFVTINPQPTLVVQSPITHCLHDSINLTSPSITAGSTSGGTFSYWTDSANTHSLLNPIAIGTSDTNYIKLTALGGCSDSKAVITIFNEIPITSFTGLNTYNCLNSSPQLLVGSPPGGVFSGNGIVGDTFTASIAGIGTQPITYTITDTINGCSGSASQFVEIMSPSTIRPDICMVTVDDSSKYNVVYWDKTAYTNVDSFIVYRDTAANNYERLAAISVDSLSLFIDTLRDTYSPSTGNPNTASYRYKIQILDTCGNYSVLSNYQNSIYVTQSGGTFNWNNYKIETQATPIPGLTSYRLLRDDHGANNWNVISTVSASTLTAADPNYASYPSGRWRIETVWSISCNPTRSITTSRSNIKGEIVDGISYIDRPSIPFTIYPNPFSENTSISYQLNTQATVCLEVYNALGQKLETLVNRATQQMGSYVYNFNPKEKGYTEGIYFVKINVDGQVAIKKIIGLK